jgi:iron complex outermembrane receptor protein
LSKQILLKRSVIAVALTLATSHVVIAQEATSDATIQKVTVTGSNIKRAEKEGAYSGERDRRFRYRDRCA